MKDKTLRAIGHIDDKLVASAITQDDLNGKNSNLRRIDMKKKNTFKWIALVAAVAIVFTVGFSLLRTPGGTVSAESVIALDVNPGIELVVGKNEKVKAVNALNDQARTVIGDMDFKGTDLDVAVNAIIGSLLKNGYLSAEQNSILVSVDSGDKATAASLKEKVSKEIEAILAGSNIKSSVIVQDYNSTAQPEGEISSAKATLINKIISAGLLDANGVPYSFDTLSKLNVNELKLMMESKNFSVEGVNAVGNASGSKYITSDKAISIALDSLGVAASDVNAFAELDYDDDRNAMVYEVEIRYGNREYDYEILATTGEVVDMDFDDEPSLGTVNPLPNETNSQLISREKALSLALAHAAVPAGSAKRVEIELDGFGGKRVYEIEFKYNSKEYEYIVNAETGEVIRFESEYDD